MTHLLSIWEYLSLLAHDVTFLADLTASTLHLTNQHLAAPVEKPAKPGFDKLPSEIQLMVIRQLPLTEISGTLPLVSKQLRLLVMTHAKQLFRSLVLGSRSEPGLRVIGGERFSSADELQAEGFARLKRALPYVEKITVFDYGSFPRDQTLAHLVNLTSLAMDTYDFIRLEPTPLRILANLAHLEELYLSGKFVAHHEARKVLQNVSKLSRLKVFKTDNFLEPHVDLKAVELKGFFQGHPCLTSIGVIFDSPRAQNNAAADGFWSQLPRMTMLREVAVGISDLSNETSLAALLAWLPATCETLYIQFGERSNPLKSALHSLQPLVQALQDPSRFHDNRNQRAKVRMVAEEDLGDSEDRDESAAGQEMYLPELREVFIDLCGTVANADLLQRELALKMPGMEIRVSWGSSLNKEHFFSHPVFR